MKENYIIYKAQNEFTGDVYVGCTTKSIEERKKDHVRKANNGRGHDFHEAISTYGKDAFVWEQIDKASSVNELAQKEKKYIYEYNSKEQGYNSDAGAGFKKTLYQYAVKDGQLINSYDCLESAGFAVCADKRSISSAALGVNKTCKGYFWSYSPSFPTSPEKLKDERRKPVIQIDLDGRILYEYKSVAEASKQTGCNKTSIAKTCRDERKSCGGFSWKYL